MNKLRISSWIPAVLALTICTGSAMAGPTRLTLSTHSIDLVWVINNNGGGQSGYYTQLHFSAETADPFTFDSSASAPWLTPIQTNVIMAGPGDRFMPIVADPQVLASFITPRQLSTTFTVTDDTGTETITVNLRVVQPLTSDASAYSVVYARTGTPSFTVMLTAADGLSPLPFTLDQAYPLPVWMIAPSASYVVDGSTPFVFTTDPNLITQLATGYYPVQVGIKPTGYPGSEVVITLTLQVSNTALPALKVVGTTTGVPGATAAASPVGLPYFQSAPTATTASVTVAASLMQLAYTATCVTTVSVGGGAIGTPCTVNNQSTSQGIAQTAPATLTAKWDASNLALPHARFGDWVTVTFTIVPVGVATPTVTFAYKFTLMEDVPTITTVSPTSVPTITGNLIVVLTGTNLVPPTAVTGSATRTQVYLSSATAPVWTSTADAVTATSYFTGSGSGPGTMTLVIPATALPVASATAKLSIAVQNLTNGVAFKPNFVAAAGAPVTAGLISINVTTYPNISAITNSASFLMPLPGNPTRLAPFEILSLFGNNFTFGQAVPASGAFVSTLTNNAFPSTAGLPILTGASSTSLKVTFTPVAGGTPVYAPILFATANQINAIVPGSVATGIHNVKVIYFTGATATATSDPFPVTMRAYDPAIYTLDASGQGSAAVLNYTVGGGGVATLNQPVTARANPGDTLSIFMTGLGTPNNTAVASGSYAYPASCITQTAFMTAAGITGGIIDGAVIQASKLGNGHFAPCLLNDPAHTASQVAVTFGCRADGGNSTPQPAAYAGWVADSVAGLYQVNVVVPTGLSSVADACPITITVGAEPSTVYNSASGVTVAIGGGAN